MKMTERTTKA